MGIGWVEAGIPQHRTAPLPPTKNHPAQDTNSAKAEKLWSPYGSIAPRDMRVPLAGSRALARCKEDAPTVASMQIKFALAPRGAQTPSPGRRRLWGEGGETCSSAGKLEGIRERTAPLSDQLPQTGALPRSWLHLPSPPSVLLLPALGLWGVRLRHKLRLTVDTTQCPALPSQVINVTLCGSSPAPSREPCLLLLSELSDSNTGRNQRITLGETRSRYDGCPGILGELPQLFPTAEGPMASQESV